MASIYELKPKFQALLRPIVGALAKCGVTANQVTVSAMLLSFLTGALLVAFHPQNWPLFLVPIVLFVRMALNAIDGMLAREHDMKSSLGAILNELGDVLSDTALYLPLAILPGIHAPMIVLVVVLALLSEMSGIIAVQIGADRRYDGPMGKSDRAFVFGLVSLLLGLGLQPGLWVTALMAIVSLLLCLTIVNRCSKALKEVA